MFRFAVVFAFWIQLMAVAPVFGSGGPPTMDIGEVKEGMKGHGISVFHGRTPERFGVEVIGVLPDFLPAQGLILIRMSGKDLERSGIVRGMSGSPVFLEGKLVGAVAYGWPFSMDPIAGVTPIKNMLEDLRRDERIVRKPSTRGALSAVWKPFAEDGDLVAAMERLGGAISVPTDAHASLAMPVALPRMPTALRNQFEAGLPRVGMVPVGSDVSSSGDGLDGSTPPVPGGALGIAYLVGDIRMAGVGTITHVDGQRMTGFGHPMMQVGDTNFPIVDAKIITVRSSRNISVKMAETGAVIGQLTGDYQASVVGRYDTRAKLVPLKINIRAPERNVDREFKMEAAPMPLMLPLIIASGLSGALAEALPHGMPYLYKIGLDWQVEEGYSGTYEKVTVTHGQAGSTLLRDVLMPLILVLANPYEELTLKSLTIDLEVVPQQRVAELRSVSVPVDEVHAGEQVELKVYLRPFGGTEKVSETIALNIPREFAGKRIALEVGAADELLTPQIPAFIDLPSYLKTIEPAGRADELVVVLGSLTADLDADGVIYPAAPPSLRAAVSTIVVDSPARSLVPEHFTKKPLKWILNNTVTLHMDVLAPRT